MAIEKRYAGSTSYYTIVCDGCGDEIGDFDDFYEAVNNKGTFNVRSVNHNGEWSDVCPNCQREMGYTDSRRSTAASDFAGVT